MSNCRLDFAAVRRKEKTMSELAASLTVADLRDLTNGMIDSMLTLIDGCTDEDVLFY